MPRVFNGLNIPISIQSVYMRDYCSKMNLTYSLPQTEICYKDNYYILKKIIHNNKNDEFNLIMSSILMLPIHNFAMLKQIVTINDLIKWHFPLEGLIIDNKEIIEWSDNFNQFKNYHKK